MMPKSVNGGGGPDAPHIFPSNQYTKLCIIRLKYSATKNICKMENRRCVRRGGRRAKSVSTGRCRRGQEQRDSVLTFLFRRQSYANVYFGTQFVKDHSLFKKLHTANQRKRGNRGAFYDNGRHTYRDPLPFLLQQCPLQAALPFNL